MRLVNVAGRLTIVLVEWAAAGEPGTDAVSFVMGALEAPRPAPRQVFAIGLNPQLP